MAIEGHYDRDADIVWLRFDGYDPATVVGEKTEVGLREVDPRTGRVVGLEVWQASDVLPGDLLDALPAPASAAPRAEEAVARRVS